MSTVRSVNGLCYLRNMSSQLRIVCILLMAASSTGAVGQSDGLRNQVSLFSGLSHDVVSLTNSNVTESPIFTVGLTYSYRIINRDKVDFYLGVDWARYGTSLANDVRFESQIDPVTGFVAEPIGPLKYHFIGLPIGTMLASGQWQFYSTLKPSVYAWKLGLGSQDNGVAGKEPIPLLHLAFNQSALYVIDLEKSQVMVGPELGIFVSQFDAGWSKRRPFRLGCEVAFAFGD